MFLSAHSATPSYGLRGPSVPPWAAVGTLGRETSPNDGSGGSTTTVLLSQNMTPSAAVDAALPMQPLPWAAAAGPLRSLSMDINRPPSDGADGAAAASYSVRAMSPSPDHAASGGAACVPPPAHLLLQADDMPHGPHLGGGQLPSLTSAMDGCGYHGGLSDPAFDELLSGASTREQWLWGMAPVSSCPTLPRLNEDSCHAASGGEPGGDLLISAELPSGQAVARKLRGRRVRSASVPNSSRLGGEARAARQQLAVSAGEIRARPHTCPALWGRCGLHLEFLIKPVSERESDP